MCRPKRIVPEIRIAPEKFDLGICLRVADVYVYARPTARQRSVRLRHQLLNERDPPPVHGKELRADPILVQHRGHPKPKAALEPPYEFSVSLVAPHHNRHIGSMDGRTSIVCSKRGTVFTIEIRVTHTITPTACRPRSALRLRASRSMQAMRTATPIST